jgi:PIN domain nuclease of toxin-antitoxin system
MSEAVVLDTHVWVDVIDGSRIAAPAARAITRAIDSGDLWIAAITVWEIAMLARKGRLQLTLPTLAWVTTAAERSRTRVAPLSPDIAADSVELPGTFHGDPADHLIVATARHHGATLITRDRAILAYGAARHVRVLRA